MELPIATAQSTGLNVIVQVIFARLLSGSTLRVCARVYGRDLYQFGISANSEIEESSVAFALTLSAPPGQNGASIYNSVATSLGNYVESAVNDIEVNVDNP